MMVGNGRERELGPDVKITWGRWKKISSGIPKITIIDLGDMVQIDSMNVKMYKKGKGTFYYFIN